MNHPLLSARRLTGACALTLAACSGPDGVEPPGPPSGLSVVSAVPASVPVGTPLPDSVRVRVTDANGRAVANVTVRWVVSGGGGTVSPPEVLTDPAGVARVQWTVGRLAGEQRLTASMLTSTGAAVQVVTTQAVAGPITTVRVSPVTMSLRVGETRQVSATVQDAYGNAVTGRTVAWSSSANAVASVDQNGVVTARAVGAAEITATVDGASGRASVSVVPGPPSGTVNAVRFDGVDDYVQVADAPSLDFGTGDFTWEVWLRRSRTDRREDVLSKKDLFADSWHDVVLLIESDGRANAFLRLTPGSSTVIVSSEGRIGTEWTHVAMTRSGGLVRLYVNGALEGTGTAAFDVSSTGPLRIGANRINDAGPDAPPVFPFAGQVHEVRVWSTARTGQQVADGMLQCIPRGTPGLVADLRFTEGSGTVAADASGNGNSGALKNGTAWVVAPARCPTS